MICNIRNLYKKNSCVLNNFFLADTLSYVLKHHNGDDTNRTEVSKTTFVFKWIMIEVYILVRSNNRQNL